MTQDPALTITLAYVKLFDDLDGRLFAQAQHIGTTSFFKLGKKPVILSVIAIAHIGIAWLPVLTPGSTFAADSWGDLCSLRFVLDDVQAQVQSHRTLQRCPAGATTPSASAASASHNLLSWMSQF